MHLVACMLKSQLFLHTLVSRCFIINGGVFYPTKGNKRLHSSKLNLIVIRINKNHELKNSRPCSNCLQFMKDVNINKVYYSTGNGSEIVCEKVRNMISHHVSFGNKMTEYIHKNNTNDKTEANKLYSSDKIIYNWFQKIPKLFNVNQKSEFLELLELDLMSNFPDATKQIDNIENGKYIFNIQDNVKKFNYQIKFSLN